MAHHSSVLCAHGELDSDGHEEGLAIPAQSATDVTAVSSTSDPARTCAPIFCVSMSVLASVVSLAVQRLELPLCEESAESSAATNVRLSDSCIPVPWARTTRCKPGDSSSAPYRRAGEFNTGHKSP